MSDCNEREEVDVDEPAAPHCVINTERIGTLITALLLNQGLRAAAYAATAIMSLSVNFDTSCCIGSVAGPRRLPS